MSASKIVFVAYCMKCRKDLRTSWFQSEDDDVCIPCKHLGPAATKKCRAMNDFIDVAEKENCLVIGEYVNAKTRIKCICSKGHECYPLPDTVKAGGRICKTCSGRDSTSARNNFHASIEKMGGEVVGHYVDAKTSVECVCADGHTCYPIPGNVQQGDGICRICAGKDKDTSEENFYVFVEKQGGKVVGTYINAKTKVGCICKNGHVCFPTPNKIQQGGGICKVCAGNDLETAKNVFRAKIEEFGRVEGDYINNSTPVKCICSKGHICFPTPSSVQQGHNMCRRCAGNDPETSKKNFYSSMEKSGHKIEGEYVNSHTAVRCICVNGHVCFPTPGRIQQGNGICRICAGNDLETARNNFHQRIEELGGKVIGEYKGSKIAVECLCSKNHKCFSSPATIRTGGSMCKICSGQDQETAKNNFHRRIEDLGGKVIGEYIRNSARVECLCSKGHKCFPFPSNIQKGRGMCFQCNESGGEHLVGKILKELGVDYIPQERNSRIPTLKFDFSINDNCYIEYDGEQHFKFIKFFHKNKEGFDVHQEYDRVKRNICSEQNIKLIRIDYTWEKRPLEEWKEFIINAIESEENFVCSTPSLYEWIYELPGKDIVNMLVK